MVASDAPSPTAAATASAAAVRPRLPAAARVHSSAGAAAFFRYFMALYDYSYAANDARPLLAVSDKGCIFCGSVKTNVARYLAAGEHNLGGVTTVVAVIGGPEQPGGVVVNALIDRTGSTVAGADGIDVESFRPTSKLRMDTAVRWVDGRWRMFAVAIVEQPVT